ncbi:MAG: hypothetical protein WA765_15940 [Candidatus Acidiferrum sp.]
MDVFWGLAEGEAVEWRMSTAEATIGLSLVRRRATHLLINNQAAESRTRNGPDNIALSQGASGLAIVQTY